MRSLVFASAAVMLLASSTTAQDVAVGKKAPDITMTGIDGKEFKLSDAAKQGKNVALMFSRANW